MCNIEKVETRTLADIYEMVRKSKRLENMIDFPSANSFKNNPKVWRECIKYSLENVNITQSDLNIELSKMISAYDRVKEITDLYKLEYNSSIDNPDFRFCISWMLIILIKLYLLRFDVDTKIKSSTDFENKIMSQKDNTELLWRGQTNSKYDFVPSIFRCLTTNQYFKFKDLLDSYDVNNLLDKYIEIFNINKANPDTKDYIDFFAYMQHSVSYSPMLDLTDKVEIASIFANNFYKGTNYNDYVNTDSAIFSINRKLLNCDIDIEHKSLEEFSVQVITNKLKYSDTIFNKHLWELSFDDLRVKFALYSRQTNDRMKYQHGYFIVPYHAVIINNKMLFTEDSSMINKYVIDKDYKQKIYSDIIDKYSYLDYDYLMDPYLYFGVMK